MNDEDVGDRPVHVNSDYGSYTKNNRYTEVT